LWIWRKLRVPREVTSWAMRKLGVEEWLVLAVMSMYTGAKTVVRTVYCNSKGFEVKVGMHQGSALSPLLFMIVMEAISREFRVALRWELLYADDLAVGLPDLPYFMGDPVFQTLSPASREKPSGRTNLPYSVSQIVASLRRHCDM